MLVKHLQERVDGVSQRFDSLGLTRWPSLAASGAGTFIFLASLHDLVETRLYVHAYNVTITKPGRNPCSC